MPYELSFLKELCLTILAELLAGWSLRKLLHKQFSFGLNAWKFSLIIAATTFMTLPYVWFIWPYLVRDRLTYIILSELWVAAMEAVFYTFAFQTKWQKALLFSLILNTFSFAFGIFCAMIE